MMSKAKKLIHLLEVMGSSYQEISVPLGNEDESIDIELVVEVWSDDEGRPGYRNIAYSVETVKIDKDFDFMGKHYKMGQDFPDELVQYLDKPEKQEADDYFLEVALAKRG
jgi:hypothetical protein